MTTAWPFDPALDDRAAEIAWQTRELTPESPLTDKLIALSNLVPTLALMTELDRAALLEELRERFKFRATDLAGLKVDIKAARKALEAKGRRKGKSLELADLEEGFRLHPAIDFPGEVMTIGFRVPLPDNESGLLLVISDGQGVRAEVDPEMVEIGDRVYQIKKGSAPPLLADVWGLDRLKAFMARPPSLKNFMMIWWRFTRPSWTFPNRLTACWRPGPWGHTMLTCLRLFPFCNSTARKKAENQRPSKLCGAPVLTPGKGET